MRRVLMQLKESGVFGVGVDLLSATATEAVAKLSSVVPPD
jgi:hypothetical protein